MTQSSVADEVAELCRRVLGPGGAAEAAVRRALAAGFDEDRLSGLRQAVRECRREGDAVAPVAGEPSADAGLREAVAAELSSAVTRMPERQREVLALRERFGLGYEEIAGVMGIEPAAVAALLARARLRLRTELRGAIEGGEAGGCAQRERALPALNRRQDRQEVDPAEADWIRDHIEECRSCERDHAIMLEASLCYRGWAEA